MKKVIAVLLIAMFLLLCGCGEKDEDEYERFATEYAQGNNGAVLTGYIMVIRDTETGVAYLFYKNGYGGGLTQLVEVKDG